MSLPERLRSLLHGPAVMREDDGGPVNLPEGSDAARTAASGELWCAVANVVAERPYGPGGSETRRGTRHFSPNAKVYVVDYYWGMGGENVTVIGRSRMSRHLITIVVPSKILTNWRARLLYKPAVLARIAANPNWNGVSTGRGSIDQIVEGYNGR